MAKQLRWDVSYEKVEELVAEELEAAQRGNRSALDRLHEHVGTDAEVSLETIRESFAVEHNFHSWKALLCYVNPDRDDFLRLSCLVYGEDRPGFRARARELLTENPELGRESIFAAAAIGDADLVGEFLQKDPDVVSARGGTFDWQPLMYACYSRLNLPGKSTLAVAHTLLDAGADPNTHYMWGGQYRFTALTGAFGEGEMGPGNQPRHEKWRELAELLLARGADPNDGQALYNQMFTHDDDCISMLLDAGLNASHRVNWLDVAKNDEYHKSEVPILSYQLNWAVKSHHPQRVSLILDQDVAIHEDDEVRPYSETLFITGEEELANRVVALGGKPTSKNDVRTFLNLTNSNRIADAKSMLDEDAGLVRKAQKKYPTLLNELASAHRNEQVEAMLEVGFDVTGGGNTTPLHEAAFRGNVELIQLLLEKGAPVDLHEPRFGSSPLGWARHFNEPEAAALLATKAPGIFDAIVGDDLTRVTAIVEDQPDKVDLPLRNYILRGDRFGEDWVTPLVYAVRYDRISMIELLLSHNADVNIKTGDGKTLLEAARENAPTEIVELLESAVK